MKAEALCLSREDSKIWFGGQIAILLSSRKIRHMQSRSNIVWSELWEIDGDSVQDE